MKSKDNRSNNGRNPYKDRGDVKKQFSLYIKKKVIEKNGGEDKLKYDLYTFIDKKNNNNINNITNEEIKTLADCYYTGNSDWLNKEQEQDTKVGWRQGFAYALSLFAVSWRSEQLFAFLEYCDNAGWIKNVDKKRIIDDYEKANNCA